MLVSDLASRPARPACSRVLRLRGLPYRALEGEIFRFLEPVIVTKVHICRRNCERVRQVLLFVASAAYHTHQHALQEGPQATPTFSLRAGGALGTKKQAVSVSQIHRVRPGWTSMCKSTEVESAGTPQHSPSL